MGRDDILTGFRQEAKALVHVVSGLSETEFAKPTPCAPWTVTELLAHVVAGIERVTDGLTVPEPATAPLNAVNYYNPRIFDAQANIERVALAQHGATAYPSGRAVVAALDAAWPLAHDSARREPDDRRVMTRWNIGMGLTDFLITRVAELALHGLDLATALDRAPWTTPEAADIVTTLLLVSGKPDDLTPLGWDPMTYLAKASGRAPLTADEAAHIEQVGVEWIPLG
ncbi:maleylpyruvate isomerase N-terminal domain-containing protein [Nocardia sp. CA-136227]|uniref:maleylpyruvate isomerase N-terminal domain-containing protein n=1 Tax=Nocardia sp. CA-136227 TaxID=3239979 RepID=UPI003D96C118